MSDTHDRGEPPQDAPRASEPHGERAAPRDDAHGPQAADKAAAHDEHAGHGEGASHAVVEDRPLPKPTTLKTVGVFIAGIVVLIAAAAGAALLAHGRRSRVHDEGTERTRTSAAGPTVSVTLVGHSSPDRTLRLVGEARPFFTTTLYAKVSGYLRDIRVDRGDHVTDGQLIATVETPETEAQYRSAVAELSNRRDVATRYHALAGPGVVSAQDVERAETDLREAGANARVIAITRGYRELRAPFAGVVTARYADPGALVQSATGSQAGALPIVRVSLTERLRVFIYLEQRDATLVHVGDAAEVTVPERADVHLHATVARIAGELDPQTRTQLTEVDVENHEGAIAAGSFVNVVLHLTAPVYPLVPANALVFQANHPLVAVIDSGNRVRLRPLELIDDDGTVVRVATGVQAGERIALDVGDTLVEGQRVQPVMSTPPRGTPGAPGAPGTPGGDAGR